MIFSVTVNEVTIMPYTHDCVDVNLDVDRNHISDIVDTLVDELSNNEKQDLFDKLKEEGYGND